MTVAIDARLVGGTATGDSTYWTCLLWGLAEIGTETKFLLITDREPPNERIPKNAEWVVKRAPHPRLWSLATFPLEARRRGADLIHTQYSLSPLAGKRGITTVHDVSFLIGPQWFNPRDRMILSRTVPAACLRAQRVITVSETSRGEIERLIPGSKGKVRVATNACPPWIKRIDRALAQEKVAALSDGKPYALTVGTRWPRKNMGLAVRAMDALPDTLPHRLLVTGKAGWGDQELGARGRATGYVDREMLSALYSGADLYLAPSLHEGFGIPALEAFRCHTAVLCGPGGALPEVVGAAGVVTDGFETSEWTEQIETLLRDPSKLSELGSAGARREQDFSWTESARRHLEIYEEAFANVR